MGCAGAFTLMILSSLRFGVFFGLFRRLGSFPFGQCVGEGQGRCRGLGRFNLAEQRLSVKLSRVARLRGM